MKISLSDPTRPIDLASPAIARPTPAVTPRNEGEGAFAEMLRGIGRELGRGEATTRAAITSMSNESDMPPSRLIALQTGVYRYSETIDLASHLVDRVTSGVKTVLQGGGQ
jgi:hypothetical protein